MRLRTTLLILASLALLSTAIGGYFYYTNLKLTFTADMDQKAVMKVSVVKNHLSAFLAEQLKPVRALAGLTEMRQTLLRPDTQSLGEANAVLDHFSITLGADVCYLMDTQGSTVASSNRMDEDSFVGRNFSFRPYFQQAIRGTPGTYMALGTTSNKRGVYYSYPVLDELNRQPVGVAVIKASTEVIDEEFQGVENEFLLLTDPHGIIFLASKEDWLFHSLWRLDDEAVNQVQASRQFGSGPWPWLGFRRVDAREVMDEMGRKFYLYRLPLDEFPDWQLIYLKDIPSRFTAILLPALRTAGSFTLPLFFLIGISVFILYRHASGEIIRRKAAEQALRESEERFRTLYLHTPALLHSIDPAGRLVSVSDYWTEKFGYSREEVIGRKVTDFMSPESRQRAEQSIIPEFLRTGFCKDVSYCFVRKNGETLDVLLSAIAERDAKGKIRRSLAILVDITELKRVEAKLREEEQHRRLAAGIIDSQERERAAVARELHDELGQILTALRMDAVWLYDRLESDEHGIAGRCQAMCHLIDRTIDEVRNMAIRLRPGVLDDLGLIPALEWLVDDFENRSGISCTFKPQAIGAVDDPEATAIYRITQEALTNVARHSQATHTEVSLWKKDGVLNLKVVDDGIGFPVPEKSGGEGLGLAGIRERAALIGADLEIESSRNQGTTILMRLPFRD